MYEIGSDSRWHAVELLVLQVLRQRQIDVGQDQCGWRQIASPRRQNLRKSDEGIVITDVDPAARQVAVLVPARQKEVWPWIDAPARAPGKRRQGKLARA